MSCQQSVPASEADFMSSPLVVWVSIRAQSVQSFYLLDKTYTVATSEPRRHVVKCMPPLLWLIGLDLENLFQQCPLTRRMFVASDLDIALLEIGVNERTGERQDGQRTDDTKRDASAVHCRRRSKTTASVAETQQLDRESAEQWIYSYSVHCLNHTRARFI